MLFFKEFDSAKKAEIWKIIKEEPLVFWVYFQAIYNYAVGWSGEGSSGTNYYCFVTADEKEANRKKDQWFREIHLGIRNRKGRIFGSLPTPTVSVLNIARGEAEELWGQYPYADLADVKIWASDNNRHLGGSERCERFGDFVAKGGEDRSRRPFEAGNIIKPKDGIKYAHPIPVGEAGRVKDVYRFTPGQYDDIWPLTAVKFFPELELWGVQLEDDPEWYPAMSFEVASEDHIKTMMSWRESRKLAATA